MLPGGDSRQAELVVKLWHLQATRLVEQLRPYIERVAVALVERAKLTQATTGGKPKLLGITKRGSRYLRKNLIHGARAVRPRPAGTDTRLGCWLRALLARAHKNTVIVTLANKLARIVRAVLARGGHQTAVVG